MLEVLRQRQREEAERLRRFGHVRPPIALDHAGYKMVAVGSRRFWDKGWKTFHDFLFSHITAVLGKDWGDAELKSRAG